MLPGWNPPGAPIGQLICLTEVSKAASNVARGPGGPARVRILSGATPVYLFKTEDLVATLKAAGVDIGIATSVRKALWEEAEIYPVARSSSLVLTEDQKRLLGLFAK